MASESLSTRLAAALRDSGISPVALAEKAGTTEATISNWLNGKVMADHVKAAMLLRMAQAVGASPYWLLFGEGNQHAGQPNAPDTGPSQSVKSEPLMLAIQLVTEHLEGRGKTLPPAKRAEAITLAYELLEEGLPEAKVLRFVRAAAA